MTQKAVSPLWGPGGPALWAQPARQTTLVLSPLCANLRVEQCAQQAPAAARVVRTLDYRGVYHPATGSPKRVQPADAPPAACVVVRPAAAAPRRLLGLSPPPLRWHERGSQPRRLCRDGCGSVCCRLCGARDGRRPRPPAAVLRAAGPPRGSSAQCHSRRQPAYAPPVAPSVAADPHATLPRPSSTSRAPWVASAAQTSGCATPPCLVSPSHGDPHRRRPGAVRGSGAELGAAVRGAAGGGRRDGMGLQRSQARSQPGPGRLAGHVSLSRRSSHSEIDERLRRVFRPAETQVPATPGARAGSSERVFSLVCASLPTIKNQHFLAIIPILSEAKNLAFRCQENDRSVLSGRRRRWLLDPPGASPLTLALDSRLITSGMTG